MRWRVGDFEIDVSQRKLTKNGVDEQLQARPFDVLWTLVQNAGNLVRKEDLLDRVWHDAHVQDAALTNAIAVLRKKLGPGAIMTVSKHGYRLAAPATALPDVSRAAVEILAEGQRQMELRRTETVIKARNLFWRAIAEAPSFAEAWAWLARACRFLEKGGVEREDHRPIAEAAFARAFELDSDLACVHQFFTAFQADRGHAIDAMERLLNRLKRYPEDAWSYAGLVQACRFCGLIDASVCAHRRAIALKPDFQTSVPHTYFVACDYPRVVEAYALLAKTQRGYLDAAAWACLGLRERVEENVAERLASRVWPPLFEGLLKSLLCAIRGDGVGAEEAMDGCSLYEDPESVLYFARHLAYSGRPRRALELLSEVTRAGFAMPTMLERDPWLASVRAEPLYSTLLHEAATLNRRAEKVFQNSAGLQLVFQSTSTSRKGPNP